MTKVFLIVSLACNVCMVPVHAASRPYHGNKTYTLLQKDSGSMESAWRFDKKRGSSKKRTFQYGKRHHRQEPF